MTQTNAETWHKNSYNDIFAQSGFNVIGVDYKNGARILKDFEHSDILRDEEQSRYGISFSQKPQEV
jgi:hypothetical protein